MPQMALESKPIMDWLNASARTNRNVKPIRMKRTFSRRDHAPEALFPGDGVGVLLHLKRMTIARANTIRKMSHAMVLLVRGTPQKAR